MSNALVRSIKIAKVYLLPDQNTTILMKDRMECNNERQNTTISMKDRMECNNERQNTTIWMRDRKDCCCFD